MDCHGNKHFSVQTENGRKVGEGEMEMKLLKLKPCPFCGSLGEVHKKRNLDTYIVECTNNSCPASYMIGYDYECIEEAVEAWNTRQEGR